MRRLKINVMFYEEQKEFKVGDVIIVKSWAGKHKYEVTRVTKTQAICEVKREDGTGFTAKYKRKYSVYGSGNYHVTPVPFIRWNTNEYTVVSKD